MDSLSHDLRCSYSIQKVYLKLEETFFHNFLAMMIREDLFAPLIGEWGEKATHISIN